MINYHTWSLIAAFNKYIYKRTQRACLFTLHDLGGEISHLW